MTEIFSLKGLETQDESTLVIRDPTTKKPTTWYWTFYGPAHASTLELANRMSRESLRELAEQRQARANGETWKDEARTPDQVRERNIDNIVARLKCFTPIDLDGAGVVEFKPELARKLLLNRRLGWLLSQVVDFLGDEANFIQPSAQG